MERPQPLGAASRPRGQRTRGWSAMVAFEVLAPTRIGIAVVVLLILAIIGSSPNYPPW